MSAHDTGREAGFRQVLAEELAKCSKCGTCTTVCPIYAVKEHEAYCARGKMMLARNLAASGEAPSARLAEIFGHCLLCLACGDTCPGKVRMDRVVTAARAFLTQEQGQTPVKRLVFRHLMPRPALLNALVKTSAMAAPVGFASLPASSGLRRRFPMPFIAPDQPIPRLAGKPLRERFPEYLPPLAESLGDVVYFTGCAANYLFPTIGEAVIHALRTLGWGVHIPAAQGCCGTPVETGGEPEVARDLAETNVMVLGRFVGLPVVTACGSGGLIMRETYPGLVTANSQAVARELAARVTDISQFVMERCGPEAVRAGLTRRLGGSVAYHAPCHLERGMGVRAQPRQLLALLAESRVPMAEENRCCGSGGTYGAGHWDVSRAILDRKSAAIMQSGALAVATGCPSCLLQLEGGLVNAGKTIPVLHTAELLGWAMGYLPDRVEERVRFANLPATSP